MNPHEPATPTDPKPATTRTEKSKKTGLPRGIRISEASDDRKKRFLLFVADRFRESFETRNEAIDAGFAAAERIREFGQETRDINVLEWRRYQAAKHTYWAGKEPDWAELGRLSARKATKTVAEAVTEYLALRATAGLASGTMSQMKTKLTTFAATFGGRRLDEVSTQDLRTWLAKLTGEQAFEQWTVRDYFKIVSTFWTYARREKWTMDNPCDAVDLPRIVPEEIHVLTPEQMAELFAKSAGQPVIGRLALEAFCGLRNSSAARLVYADIDFTNKGINLPAVKHKSRRRHFIDGLPENLWAWLATVKESDFSADGRQYDRQKHDAFARAGYYTAEKGNPPHNCLRHSFATYHVAKHKDAAKTAIILQHTSPAMLYRHYKGRGTEAQGNAYFAILP